MFYSFKYDYLVVSAENGEERMFPASDEISGRRFRDGSMVMF
jgi:hypothetical protein